MPTASKTPHPSYRYANVNAKPELGDRVLGIEGGDFDRVGATGTVTREGRSVGVATYVLWDGDDRPISARMRYLELLPREGSGCDWGTCSAPASRIVERHGEARPFCPAHVELDAAIAPAAAAARRDVALAEVMRDEGTDRVTAAIILDAREAVARREAAGESRPAYDELDEALALADLRRRA